jgi:hypothetical protein
MAELILNFNHISTYTALIALTFSLSLHTNMAVMSSTMGSNNSLPVQHLVQALPSREYVKKIARDTVNPKPAVPQILQEIAICESGGRHFDTSGKVIRGKVNPNDIGKYQINQIVWGAEAERLGHDIFSEEGNEAMALEIYSREQSKPWSASKHCWGKAEHKV